MNLTLSTPWCPVTVAMAFGDTTVCVCGMKYCFLNVISVPLGKASWIGVSSSSGMMGVASTCCSVFGRNVKFFPSGRIRGSSGMVSWMLRRRHSSSSV